MMQQQPESLQPWDDPDNWSEDDWIARVSAHAKRYNVPDGLATRTVELVTAGMISIREDGTVIPLRPDLIARAWEDFLLNDALSPDAYVALMGEDPPAGGQDHD